MAKKHKKSQGNEATGDAPISDSPAPAKARPRKKGPVRKRKGPPLIFLWVVAVLVVIVAGGVINRATKEKPAEKAAVEKEQSSKPVWNEQDYALPGMSIDEIRARKLIVDVHEHIQGLREAPLYLKVMDEFGFAKMCLMGSSWFTITLNEKFGFTRYDENNAELIKIKKTFPDRFEAWPTINPLDDDKLDKLKALVAEGAQGLKLYIGHGYVTKENKYMFHTMALDDPRMLPVYEYCQENYVPVVMHVNPFKEKPGLAEELVAVLTKYPDLKICAPHFMLSSIMRSRLREYLNTFPNLYSDVSFGDSFAVAGLKRISKSPKAFQAIFRDYPNRFMFASDLVLTDHPSKTEQWIRDQLSAYLDMLSTDSYITPVVPGESLKGLKLPNWILERVLYKNYHDFIASRPKGTKITRKIDWGNMNVAPIVRESGQYFPPPPQKQK